MKILVSDTSVLVDLERGALLEAAFASDLTMAVPDLLFQRELEPYNGTYLVALGLAVTSLTPAELALAQQISGNNPALSTHDGFALVCAARAEHVLVTGDKALRLEAQTRNIDVVGLLWLLDQLEAGGVSPQELHEGLTRIRAHPRCRLPAAEISERLTKWGA